MKPASAPPASTVHTLADLDQWSFAGNALAVLGWPVDHSLSPPMHNAALARLAEGEPRFTTWRYFWFAVRPEELPVALPRLHAAGFVGLNLTAPHKIIARDLVASIDPAAQQIGAVNTLHRAAEGWRGYNTDGYGLATAVRETLALDLAGADILLLGAGGAGRSAAIEALHRGCRSLWIANRTAETRDALLAHLRPLAGATPLHGFAPAEPPRDLPAGTLVINATSAGLHAGDPLPIDLAALPRPAGVYDMIYNPAETPLLARARALGLPAANGLAMLVHQGVRSLQLWTGADVPVEEMRRAATEALAAR